MGTSAKRPRQRSQGERGMRLRDTIANHFERIESSRNYLTTLALNHPQVYCALVAKVIPQQVAVDVTHHAVDLGQLMLDAHATLRTLRDVTPQAPLTSPTPDPPELQHQPASLNVPRETPPIENA